MRKSVSIFVIMLMVLSMPCSVFAVEFSADASNSYSVSYDGATDGQQYVLLIVNDSSVNTALSDIGISASNISYIDQKAANGTSITFEGLKPRLYSGTNKVYISGTNLSATYLGNLGAPSGMELSGTVKSYNGKAAVTVGVYAAGTTTGAIATTTTAIGVDNGLVSRSFVMSNVPPGDYDLIFSKPYHLPFTLTGVPLDDDIDIGTVRMIGGDITGDNKVNVNDVTLIWNANNYGKKILNARDSKADVTGDGLINVNDATVVWNVSNYGKGLRDSTDSY